MEGAEKNSAAAPNPGTIHLRPINNSLQIKTSATAPKTPVEFERLDEAKLSVLQKKPAFYNKIYEIGKVIASYVPAVGFGISMCGAGASFLAPMLSLATKLIIIEVMISEGVIIGAGVIIGLIVIALALYCLSKVEKPLFAEIINQANKGNMDLNDIEKIHFLNQENNEGETLLYYALRNGKTKIVRFLLNNNASTGLA